MLPINKIRNSDIEKLLSELRFLIKSSPKTLTEEIKHDHQKNVYLILISCLLSLRTRDVVTWPVCQKFFKVVQNPYQMVEMELSEIEDHIKSINFYKRKAQVLYDVSKIIIDQYDGQVPATEEELLALPGVGIKTANLVLAEGFNIPAICVDTHVHRLSNRWGFVKTKTAEETEKALKRSCLKNIGPTGTVFLSLSVNIFVQLVAKGALSALTLIERLILLLFVIHLLQIHRILVCLLHGEVLRCYLQLLYHQ